MASRPSGGDSRASWNDRPTSARARRRRPPGDVVAVEHDLAPVGRRNPVSTSNNVVLPPLGPMSPTMVAWVDGEVDVVEGADAAERLVRPPSRGRRQARGVAPRRRDGLRRGRPMPPCRCCGWPVSAPRNTARGCRAARAAPLWALGTAPGPSRGTRRGGQEQRHVHRLLHQDDRRAVGVDRPDVLDQPVDHRRREAQRELVDQEQLRAWRRTPERELSTAARRRRGCRRLAWRVRRMGKYRRPLHLLLRSWGRRRHPAGAGAGSRPGQRGEHPPARQQATGRGGRSPRPAGR